MTAWIFALLAAVSPPDRIPAPPVCIPQCLTVDGPAYAERPAVRLGVVNP